jgi:carbonic anhydrase/acetyltransferase-like protein (isoleucine patch superfamily)
VALVIPVGGISPQLPSLLAPNATLVGDVRFGPGCSVWFNAVLRGDINHVALGEGCNVQDGAILHVSRALPCVLADAVSVGHAAVVHAAQVGRGSLVGMGALVLDGARLGEEVLVAAGCVVPEGMAVPDRHLVAGVPGRVVRALDERLLARIRAVAGNYIAYQELYPSIRALSAGTPA